MLMTGMPLRALQQSLDRAHALHPESTTLGDFRADPALVDAEERALAGARTIVTPHAAVAAAFGARTVRVPWAVPTGSDLNGPVVKHAREAILFPASTLGRAGAYEVRDVARSLGVHVILGGPVLEDARFWDGVSTEMCSSFGAALAAGPRAVVLPAFVENQPRRLLHAAAAGIPVIASDACGLDCGGTIEIVPAGDGAALRAAVEARFARSAR
ncbi:MAG: vanw family protein [Candidatus Eremiobacteraeota bacterium]|nr:vanw family protein [Candidatus Eremiobacteraeota bacterium]